jgi:hypothetical protein
MPPKLATMCISFSRTASDYVGHGSPYRESIQSLGYCTEMAKWNQQNAKSFSSVINCGIAETSVPRIRNDALFSPATNGQSVGHQTIRHEDFQSSAGRRSRAPLMGRRLYLMRIRTTRRAIEPFSRAIRFERPKHSVCSRPTTNGVRSAYRATEISRAQAKDE